MRPADRIDEIVGRYREALDRGEPVDPQQILRMHPDLADGLRTRFAALRLLERAYASARVQPERGESTGPRAQAGDRVGPYVLLEELGAGGMGTVFRARAEAPVAGLAVGAEVALKVVHPHLPSRSGFVRRFQREGEAGRRVRHEHVVRTYEANAYDLGEGQRLCLSMELAEGRTLRELVADLGVLPETLIREIARQVATGLQAVHDAGIVHRDVKPENILVSDDHEIRIMDLGVARLLEESRTFTSEGLFAGSLLYAAPEQFQGGSAGPAADLYALGVVMYELATGHNPFRRDTAVGVIQAHLEREPLPLADTEADVSPFLEAVVSRLLDRDPERRLGPAGRVAQILGEGERGVWWAQEAPREREPRGARPRLPVRRTTRLHGRTSELERLSTAWDHARRGRGAVPLILGEAGIGKTRLLDAFVESLRGEEAHVLYGRYAPSEGRGALSESLIDHLGATDLAGRIHPYLDATAALSEEFAAALLQAALPSDTAPLPLDAALGVLTELMRSLARERPVLWIVEDLHNAPAASRHAVLDLARAAEGHRVMLVLTATPPLPRDELARITKLPIATRIPLGRLSPREVVDLLRDAFGSDALAERLGVKVAWKSDGVPLFVFEMIDVLKDGLYIETRDDGSLHLSRAVDDIQIPSAVRDLVEARLQDLTRPERAILDVGAVQGVAFDSDLVARVLERKRVAVLRDLAEIERRLGVVTSGGRLHSFDHNQIRSIVYEDLTGPLRAEYHTLLAEARERQIAECGRIEKADAAFLARHHLRGVSPDRARPFLAAACDHLAATYEHEALLDVVEYALETPRLLPGADRVHALFAASTSLEHLGRWEEERRRKQEAIEAADTLQDPALQASARLRLGTARLDRGQSTAASALFCEARELARGAGLRREAAHAEAGLGRAAHIAGRCDDAGRHWVRSLSLAQETDDPDVAWIARRGLGTLARDRGSLEDAAIHLRAAMTLAESSGALREAGKAAAALADILLDTGDLEEARSLLDRALGAARAVGHRREEARARTLLGSLLARQGRFDDAEVEQRRALDLASELGDRALEAEGLDHLGSLLIHVHRLEEARRHLDRQVASCQALGLPTLQARGLRHLGDLAMLQGDGPVAETRYRSARDIAASEPERQRAVACLAGLLSDRGRYADAESLLDSLSPKAPDGARLRGILLRRWGDFDGSEAALNNARDSARAQGDAWREALAVAECGRTLLCRGRDDRARSCLATARSAARRLRARRHEIRFTLLLGQLAQGAGKSHSARRRLEWALDAAREDGAAALALEAQVALVAFDPSQSAAAEAAYERDADRLTAEDRIRVAWALGGSATRPERRAEARRRLEDLCAHAPAAHRDALRAADPVFRAICESAAEELGPRAQDGRRGAS